MPCALSLRRYRLVVEEALELARTDGVLQLSYRLCLHLPDALTRNFEDSARLLGGFSGTVCLGFRDRFDIIFEKRPSGVSWAEIYICLLEIPAFSRPSRSRGYGENETISTNSNYRHIFSFKSSL